MKSITYTPLGLWFLLKEATNRSSQNEICLNDIYKDYVKENKRIGTPGEFQTVSPPGEQKPKAGQPTVTKQ